MFIDLHENINKLQTVANGLRELANAFISTGNLQVSAKLYSQADDIVREINTISRKVDENSTELIKISTQSSQNVLNAALAGIELASKQPELPELAPFPEIPEIPPLMGASSYAKSESEDHSTYCEQFDTNCACLNCHPVGFCVEDPCDNCDGPTANMCEPPDANEPMLQMKACMVCKSILFFPLKECPECKRSTVTILVERNYSPLS